MKLTQKEILKELSAITIENIEIHRQTVIYYLPFCILSYCMGRTQVGNKLKKIFVYFYLNDKQFYNNHCPQFLKTEIEMLNKYLINRYYTNI